jgi:acetylornithine deacetylase/succinyl-diaminopimelate desuccinylase-like protein
MADDITALLRELVGIPSVDPHLTDNPAHAGEARMARFLADWLEARGFRVELKEVQPARPNLIARFGPAHPRRTLLIEGHLDTQGVHGMVVPPFDGEIRDGRLFGRGACDMKGPMAAALWSFAPDVLEALAGAGVQLIFVGAMGEERGNTGAMDLVARGFRADEAVVLEPTGLEIVLAHKGTLWFETELVGLAAHGAQPDAGVNAIRAAAELIRRLPVRPAGPAHPVLGPPTLNAGVIRGGTSVNIVAERCAVEWDRRMLPGEDADPVLGEVRAQLDALRREGLVREARVQVIKATPPFETAGDAPLIGRLGRACVAEGRPARTAGTGWYSDAGILAPACGAICVFGPGDIAQAHTAGEYIDLEQLEAGARILRRFLLTTAAGAGKGA